MSRGMIALSATVMEIRREIATLMGFSVVHALQFPVPFVMAVFVRFSAPVTDSVHFPVTVVPAVRFTAPVVRVALILSSQASQLSIAVRFPGAVGNAIVPAFLVAYAVSLADALSFPAPEPVQDLALDPSVI